MRLLLLLLVCLPLTTNAQNIGRDVSRLLDLVPLVAQADTGAADEFVSTLAYYVGMPDRDRVVRLANGPQLMAHLGDNPEVRDFLLQTGVAPVLDNHFLTDRRYLDSLFAQRRSDFLTSKTGSELFADAGPVNLEQIRSAVTSSPLEEFTLVAASKAAASRNQSLSANTLVSNALVGLSDFIAKRAQQELTYTFLDRLREYLNEHDLQYLFPETAGYLPDLDLLNYRAILPSIRRAFAQDLRAISFNLGNYLEARDADSFRDPAVYNLFLVYRILDLEYREVPLPDILGFTFGELNRARTAVRSQIDLQLVEATAGSPAYTELTQAFGAYAGAVSELDASLRDAVGVVDEDVEGYLDTLAELDLTDEEITELVDQIFAASPIDLGRDLPLEQAKLNAETTIANSFIIQEWLNGREAYAYYEAYPSLTSFDEFFGQDATPFDSTERRAAGLQALRQVVANQSVLDRYRTELQRLEDSRVKLFTLQSTFREEQTRKAYMAQPLASQIRQLADRIDGQRNQADHPALRLLAGLLVSLPDEPEAVRTHLAAVEDRFVTWLTDNRPLAADRYLDGQLQKAGREKFDGLARSIDVTDKAFTNLRAALAEFNQASISGDSYTAYQNLSTFETVFGIARQTLFLLAGDDDLFADKGDLAIFQTDAAARALLAGLSRERFRRVPGLGQIDPAGLTSFLLDLSLSLDNYRPLPRIQPIRTPDGKPSPDDSPADTKIAPRSKRLVSVEFFTHVLSTLLEAPILQNPFYGIDPSQATGGESLAERYPRFAKAPALNRELGELFSLTQTGEYRYAIDNLLTLIDLLGVLPRPNQNQKRLEGELDSLRTLRLELLREYARATGAETDYDAYSFLADPDLLAVTETMGGVIGYGEGPVPTLDTVRLRQLELQIAETQRSLASSGSKTNRRFQENFFKYGTFMADVAGATTPQEIERALTNIALPPGSSQIKRTRPSSVEVGAYFGVSLGLERLVLPAGQPENEQLEEATPIASLFVPVGLSYSRNIGGRKSATLFASILDLGALTAFRLEDGSANGPEVQRLPDFSFRNVVAPGLTSFL